MTLTLEDYYATSNSPLGEPASATTAGTGGEQMEPPSGTYFRDYFATAESLLGEPASATTAGTGGEQMEPPSGAYFSNYVATSESPLGVPSAGPLIGSGTAIATQISGMIDFSSSLSEDDAPAIEEAITFHHDAGVPLRFEFEWQEADIDVDWPVTVTSTFAAFLTNPDILEDIDIGAVGADCTVEASIGEMNVDSETGLVIAEIEWVINCPTDVVADVTLEFEEDAEEQSTTVVASDPIAEVEQEFGSGSGSEESVQRFWGGSSGRYRRVRSKAANASLTGSRCLPSGESDRLEVRIHYAYEPYQSYRAVYSYDPAEVVIDDVHADNSVFNERNERSRYTWAHRMNVDSYSIDNEAGRLEIEASASTSIRQGRRVRTSSRIMTSVEVTVTGSDGIVAELEPTTFDLYDSSGNLVSPQPSASTARLGIDNGISVESTYLEAGETSRIEVDGRIGETFDEYRMVFALDPAVVDTFDVQASPATPGDVSLELIPTEAVNDDYVRGNQHYAVVSGALDAETRMSPLFEFVLGAHTEAQLLADVEAKWDDYFSHEMIPSSTSVRLLDREDVALLNTEREAEWTDPAEYDSWTREERAEMEMAPRRPVAELPVDELPLPYIGDEADSFEWRCSSNGEIRHESVEIVDECASDESFNRDRGWCIPEIGIVYWPLVFDLVVELPGIAPGSVTRDDIRSETTSETNPAIAHTLHDPLQDEASLLVPLSVVIPKNEWTEPEKVGDLAYDWHVYGQASLWHEADRYFAIAINESGERIFLEPDGEVVVPEEWTDENGTERIEAAIHYFDDPEETIAAIEAYNERVEASLEEGGEPFPTNELPDFDNSKPSDAGLEWEYQLYPIHYDFDMWLGGRRVTFGGGASGLHLGGDITQGGHSPAIIGRINVERIPFGIGGWPF